MSLGVSLPKDRPTGDKSKSQILFHKMKPSQDFYLVHLIRTTNKNLEFLQRIFVYLLWQDKSFKLRPKYIKKCQYNSLHTKK